MKAFISHRTALDYWRSHPPSEDEPKATANACADDGADNNGGTAEEPDESSDSSPDADACAHKVRHIMARVPESCRPATRPVDVLVFDIHQRGHSPKVAYHLWQGPVPSDAFYCVQDMCVSSPEFVFLQMASELPLIKLVTLGFELCGRYAMAPRPRAGPAHCAVTRAEPLTTPSKLEEFLRFSPGAYGRCPAMRALKYVAGGSRSPLETATYLQFCLPPALGGYGIAHPQINRRIEVATTLPGHAGPTWFDADLCWPEARLALEYDDIVHKGAIRTRGDIARRMALERAGWSVMTLAGFQVPDIAQFERVAVAISKQLGHRLRRSTLGPTRARLELHEQLATSPER